MKEKIYRDKINELNKQLGGNSKVDLSTIQKEILKIQMKLDDIESRKVDSLIDPYSSLKDMIDKINTSVNEIDKNIEILGEDQTEMKKKEILNKIRDINVVLDADPKDYNKLIAETKLNFVGERLNPQLITAPITAHIEATEELIKQAKEKLGGGLDLEAGDTLVENADFYKIFQDISGKIFEFETKKIPFNSLKEELETYIKQMEDLFSEETIAQNLEEPVPKAPGNEALLIDVDESKVDNGLPELDLSERELAIVADAEVDQLIEPTFLNKIALEEDGVVSTLLNTGKKTTVVTPTSAGVGGPAKREESDESLVSLERRLDDEEPEGKRRKYLKFNEKYYQEPDTKKLKLTDEKVLQSMNTLHNEWVTKMKDYQTYLVAKKGQLDKISKNNKILKVIKSVADKYVPVYETLKLDKTQLNILVGTINDKLAENAAYTIQLDTTLDITIPEIDAEFGKAEIRQIRTKLENTRDEIRESVEQGKACLQTINTNMGAMGLGRFLLNQTPEEIILMIKGELLKNPNIFTQKMLINKANRDSFEAIKNCIATMENLTKNKEIYAELNRILPSIEVVNKYFSSQIGGVGERNHINDVIEELRLYEIEVRKMKEVRKELELLIKKYNIRYVQFYNFQKYIVNYVSIKIAAGGYSYYQYVSKGLISYYGELLKGLTEIFNKFDEYKKFGLDPDLKKSENKWFYGKHYFMIKILNKFFNKLYELWDLKEKSSDDRTREAWNRDVKQVKTDDNNTKYWFLFNIFINILDAYSMTLPSIANYIRINEIKNIEQPGGPNISNIKTITFNKGSKYSLELSGSIDISGNPVPTGLNECPLDPTDNIKTNEISDVKFQEVFDKDFTNDSLSNYMGLSNFLKKGKSIMILTYGYSGVGKTFTLFGKKEAKGMLQSTLAYLGDSVNIEVKPFELYGLGVPYKFYWKDSTKFTHFIYGYTIKNKEPLLNGDAIRYEREKFSDFLDKNKYYSKLDLNQINNFSNIVELIDIQRKNAGRIKSTVNNPESSRSIMIYDFKITKKNTTSGDKPVHFVVMDLPGKENLFETYCAKEYPNFELDERFTKFIDPTDEQRGLNGGKYDSTFLKAMFYINPLWLSLIPETAKHFDTQNVGKHFNLKNPNGAYDEGSKLNGDPIPVYGDYLMKDSIKPFTIKLLSENNKEPKSFKNTVTFTKLTGSNANLQYGVFTNKREDYANPSAISKLLNANAIRNKLGLNALMERSMFTIVKLIKEGELEKLGELLNGMLANPDARAKNYGYAGLEGIYINENILGLLQVLANRIRKIKKKDVVPVVCQQTEVYKTLYKKQPTRLGIDVKLLESANPERAFVQINADETGLAEGEEIKKDQSFFVDDDEFYSQIMWMTDNGRNFYYEDDHYNDRFTREEKTGTGDDGYFLDSQLRDPEKMKEYADKINNYNYNKIFNIEEPPIQKVLGEYLNTIDNYYLFFVVSNNLKSNPGSRPVLGEGIETCAKQMKLIHDTRYFMSVISAQNEDELLRVQCNN